MGEYNIICLWCPCNCTSPPFQKVSIFTNVWKCCICCWGHFETYQLLLHQHTYHIHVHCRDLYDYNNLDVHNTVVASWVSGDAPMIEDFFKDKATMKYLKEQHWDLVFADINGQYTHVVMDFMDLPTLIYSNDGYVSNIFHISNFSKVNFIAMKWPFNFEWRAIQ